MALWIFMLLFLGISEASSFGENTDCFEECYANILTKQLPKLLARNEKTFTKEMKEDFYACAEREMKRCGWWDFGSSKETQSVCDSVAGCTEGEDETGNKYSFLHCLDEHRPDLVVCYANYILEFMEAVVTGEKIQEPEDVYMCSFVKSIMPCFREVSIQKCGKDGTELFKKEFGRNLPKHVMDSCPI